MLYRFIAAALLAAVLVLSTTDQEEAVEPPKPETSYGVAGYWVLARMEQHYDPAPPIPPATVVETRFTGNAEQWRALVSRYPGWNVDDALKVIQCESGGDPGVVSSTGDYGLFQLNAIHGIYLDPEANVLKAYGLWADYGSWYHWRFSRGCHGLQ